MCILKSAESEAAGLSARKPNTARTEKWKGKKKKDHCIQDSRNCWCYGGGTCC